LETAEKVSCTVKVFLLNDKRKKNTWYLRELLREGGERERYKKYLKYLKKRDRERKMGTCNKR
jgi:hypothetical protein